MAIPKTLKSIPAAKALALVARHEKAGTGEWEGSPRMSDFVYGSFPKLTLLRPPCCCNPETEPWETGRVSM